MTHTGRTLREVIRSASMAGYIGAEVERRIRDSRGSLDPDWSRYYEDMAVTQARSAARYANQALAALLVVDPLPHGWRDIETAPKDFERSIMVFAYPAPAQHDGGYEIATWEGEEFGFRANGGGAINFRPTHWMPLPDPPVDPLPQQDENDQGAALLPADPSAAVKTEALPNAVLETAYKIIKGFIVEDINGVICATPEDGLHLAPHRTWCAACQKRWQLAYAWTASYETRKIGSGTRPLSEASP